jgi:hypothetical protein
MSRTRTLAVAAAGVALAAPLATATAGTHPTAQRTLLTLAPRPHLDDVTIGVGSVLGGRTSQKWPVVIALSRNRKRIASAETGLAFTCGQAEHTLGPMPDGYSGVPLRKGRASADFGPNDVDLGNGMTGHVTGSFTAKLNRLQTKAKGTWRMTVAVTDGSGAAVDTCDTGPLTWTARQ